MTLRVWVLAGIFALMGCGGGGGGGGGGGTDAGPPSPLVGTWTHAFSGGGMMVTIALTFGADGNASGTISETGCTGMVSEGGLMWTATDGMLDLTGMQSCSGEVDCGGMPTITCTAASMLPTNNCSYTLSADNNTLNLTCGDDGGTALMLMRQ